MDSNDEVGKLFFVLLLSQSCLKNTDEIQICLVMYVMYAYYHQFSKLICNKESVSK